MKDIPVFVSVKEKCVPESLHGDKTEMANMQSCRIPSLISADNIVIAACDKANCGADWGFIEIAVRRSDDSGAAFGELQTVFTPPVRIAPVRDTKYTSSFAIDPVTAQAADGTIIMMFDFYPESKGLHKANLLVRSNGYEKVNGEYQRKLFDKKHMYLVHDDGFVYTGDGKKTNYYLPKNHDPKYAYQTIGDMYYTDGEPEFLTEYPPLIPDNAKDKYAGNIFLKRKNRYRLSDASKKPSDNGFYDCIESSAAPMTAPVTSYLWVMKSRDGGKTWSQPEDITPQVKTDRDEPFFGVGPGSGQRLSTGRLLIPVYSVGKAYIIYSDDGGESWNRTSFCENIDECQLAEYADGTVACLGRPEKPGAMPYSISHDGGITWQKVKNDLYSARCQHSLISVPSELYAPQMDKAKDYVICSRPTGHRCKDGSRTDGCAALGEVQSDYTIRWLKELELKTDAVYEASKEYHDFFAYSCMAVLPDGKIGILYEAFPSGYIAFKKFETADFFI